jgi:predicted nuclease with RNAse H fold
LAIGYPPGVTDTQTGSNTSVTEHFATPALALGVDLRSAARYPTGLAVLGTDARLRLLRTVRTDAEIEAAVAHFRPSVIAIDAPLGLPEGRCCADSACGCARLGILRAVDRACIAAGYRPYPTLLPSMVGLTLRGIALSTQLIAAGEQVVEAYPGMVQDILGIPRKRAGLAGLTQGLRRAGVRGIPRVRRVTHDELDAATCALVGVLHLQGRTATMGPGVPVPLAFPTGPLAGRSGTVRALSSSRIPIALHA